MTFDSFDLDAKLLKALAASGFHEPTPIQGQAIPAALLGGDVMACAQTGTGKTAAFVLPMLQRLLTPSSGPGRGPRALVLTPTRELALQVHESILRLGRFCQVLTGTVVGGVPYGPQYRLFEKPLDILVATPGRLMDHMAQGRVRFERLEVLVLDEADRMLDMGFLDAVRKIAASLPQERQTLLFSATLEGAVLGISRQLMKEPVRITLATNHDAHAAIAQVVHLVDDAAHKRRLLAHYLADTALMQGVIFTATKRGADKLAKDLSFDGHASTALHGNMNQSQRQRAIEGARRGKYRLLVATDVAARGLDIKGLSHVINYDLPMVAEDYIHRIGRTGRAGASGQAISLVDAESFGKLVRIERLIGRKLDRTIISGLEPIRPEPRHADARNTRPGARNGKRPASPPARQKTWDSGARGWQGKGK